MVDSMDRKSFIADILKAAIYSLFFCVVSVLLLALILKLFELDIGGLGIINQVLKCISVFLGCFIAVRPDKGFFKGLLGGLVFVLLSNIVFCILGGSFGWGQVAIDLACGLVVGGLGGAFGASKKSN
jgi:putative membrane protein (TIGR04086 family)